MPSPAVRRLLLFGAAKPVTYLLGPFRFTNALAAPLASPYAEGGAKGSLVVTDTASKLSTSGGTLSLATGGAGAGDPGAWGAGLTRAAGLALLERFVQTSGTWECGWDTDQTTAPGENYLRLAATALSAKAGATSITSDAVVAGTAYDAGVVLRSAGAFYLVKGGVYTSWALLWVDPTQATATVYPAPVNNTTDGVAVVQGGGPGVGPRVVALPAPWNTDYGIATTRLAGARSAGDAFTHTADALIEFVATTLPGVGAQANLLFREQDASNAWKIVIRSDGTFQLYERVATIDTVRADSGSGVAVNGSRIVVVAVGSVIKGYANNVLKWTYSSATNFQTATAGLVNALQSGSAVSNVVAWPRNVSIPAGY